MCPNLRVSESALFFSLQLFRHEDEKPASAKKAPPSFKAGLLVCVLSGIFLPMLNVAVNFDAIAKRAKLYGADGAATSTSVLGTGTPPFLCCPLDVCWLRGLRSCIR